MDVFEVGARISSEVGALLNRPVDFPGTDPLVDHGLDSLGSVQLTLNLEDAFGLVFEDDEISFENFSTIEGITQLIVAKLGGERV
ncbi:acyl carrier protein [Nonomuraea sp. NPDC004297]